MTKKFSFIFVFLCIALFLPMQAQADGMLLPERPDQTIAPIREIPNFSVKYHRVNIEIANQVARTRIDQVFHNETQRELEATYIFPISPGASLSNFSMDVDGKMTPAKLLDQGEARRIYEEIVRQRIDPALLEYMGQNLFRARIFPIPARGDKQVKLSYDQVIPQSNQLHEYRYTLSTEKFSARPLNEVVVNLKLKTQAPLKTIYSPTHNVHVKRIDDYNATVSYEEKNVKPDKDFVLYYSTSDDAIGLSLLSYREDDDGYFMLMASPKVKWDKQKALPKHIVYVLDTSGSMSGEKIVQAKAALSFALNHLDAQDFFNVVAFSDTVEPFYDAPQPASSKNIKEALRLVSKLEATGGTDINSAMLQALKSKLHKKNVLDMIVFLTDGDPTVGETNPEKILANVKGGNQGQRRVFIFGVGYDVNIHFLDKMSEQNKGSSEYVRPEENIEVKVSNLVSRISHPVLSEPSMEYGSVKTSEVFPRELPDLFKGSQLILTGRYQEPGKTTVTLKGNVQGQMQRFPYAGQEFTAKGPEFDFLPRLWATRKIGYLLDQIRLMEGKNNQELVEEVIRLSKRYGVITEYTSFLVREDVDIARPTQALAEEAKDKSDELQDMQKGSGAVSQSQNIQAQKAAPNAAVNKYYDNDGKEQIVTQVQYVAKRAFFQKKNVWQDGAIDGSLPKIKIKRFGDAYFALAQNADIRNYLALGDLVAFVWKGQVLEISDEGTDQLTPELKGKLGL